MMLIVVNAIADPVLKQLILRILFVLDRKSGEDWESLLNLRNRRHFVVSLEKLQNNNCTLLKIG